MIPQRLKHPRARALVIAGVAAVVVVVAIWVVLASGDSKLTWLTPQQAADASKPGPFQSLRQKVRVWAGPVLRWYRRGKAELTIEAKVFKLSKNVDAAAGLGAPSATNANGMRAWVLETGNVAPFTQQLAMQLASNGGKNWNTGRMLTVDGQRTLADGARSVLMGTNYVTIGFTTEYIPKVSENLIRLTVSAKLTDPVMGEGEKYIGVRTNFYTACRVTVPSGGGLVIQCPDLNDASLNYWLVIEPVITPKLTNPLTPMPLGPGGR